MHIIKLSIYTLLISCLSIAFAQTPEHNPDEAEHSQTKPRIELDEVIVTSSRFKTDPWKVGSTVHIITRKDIERMGVPAVREILNTIPGLRTSANGLRSTSQSVFIRGVASSGGNIKIFVDGIEQNYGGLNSSLFYLDVNNIERIEVIKGGGSTFYGANVSGGVINVITKKHRAKALSLSGFFEGGSFSTFKESLSLKGYFNGLTYSASVLREDSQGLSKAKNTNADVYFDSDRYNNTDVSASLGYEKEKYRFRVKTRYQEIYSEYDAGAFKDRSTRTSFITNVTNITVLPGEFVKEEHWYQDVFYSHDIVDFYQYAVAYNYHWSDTTNALPSFPQPRKIFERHAGYFQNNFVFKPIRASLGIDFFAEKQEVVGSTNFPATNNNIGLYLDVARETGKYFNFSAGVRYDINQTTTNQSNELLDQLSYRGSIAGLYEDFKLNISYGRSIVNPSLSQITFGGSNLMKQIGHLFDVGLTYRNKNLGLIVNATYFLNDFTNSIEWDPAIGSFGAYTNLNYRAQGVEFSFKYKLPINDLFGFTIGGNYTYTDAKDPLSTNQQNIRRPEHQANVNFNTYLWKDLNINLDFDWVGETYSFARNKIDEYVKLDLNLSYLVSKSFTPYIRIENLLNQDYVTTEGYSEPGISFYGGFRFRYQ